MLSKHAWAISLKTKNGNEMATAIAKIIQGDARCPKNLQTDMGKEFYNANVQKLLKKTQHKSLFNIFHNEGICERFNRTMKNDMWKQFTHDGNYK